MPYPLGPDSSHPIAIIEKHIMPGRHKAGPITKQSPIAFLSESFPINYIPLV
ncbi:hypothetical protein ASZ90_019673 [hydrocarbon metagenome]|uniref:Uncharacterized protein n=1 Tax=hydrocarbon metagenome TaxID=938273 RepID=A0A0W8E3H7_9ZZZZ